MLKQPPPGVLGVAPNGANLSEVHFVLAGPPGSDFAGGQYHGVLELPQTYPAAPPALRFFTPSGRFEPGKKVCTTFSDFHPESWSVTWRLSTILTATLSFLVDDAASAGTTSAFGFTRRELAAKSWRTNANNATFRQLFPQLCDAEKGDKMLIEHRGSMQKQQLAILAALILVLLAAIVYRVYYS